MCKLLFTVTITIRNFVGSLCHRPYSKRALQPILCSTCCCCMKQDVFNENITQSTALHTIHKQRHSRTMCLFLFTIQSLHTTLVTRYKITESQSVVQHSLSSMSSSQATCPYNSFCHLKAALMHRRFFRPMPVRFTLHKASPNGIVYYRVTDCAVQTGKLVLCSLSIAETTRELLVNLCL